RGLLVRSDSRRKCRHDRLEDDWLRRAAPAHTRRYLAARAARAAPQMSRARATESFDAVIVGSGAGGGTTAYALTQAGFRVCVLEKGPHYKSEDFFHDELAVCRRDYFVPSPLDEPHMVVRPGQPAAERTTDGWIACCVGGGTIHMSGFFFRLHRE